MRLHKDKDAFRALLSSVSETIAIREDIIEKDYYLTLLLSELAAWQSDLPAYFKGCRALYKTVGSLKRFSEDIDLTVEVQGCSPSQGKKRLEKARMDTPLYRERVTKQKLRSLAHLIRQRAFDFGAGSSLGDRIR